MRQWLLGLVCGLAVAIGGTWIGLLAARFILHGSVDAVSLAKSVNASTGGSGAFGVSPCEPAGAVVWRCDIAQEAGSGPPATYRVTLRDGGSCWDARRIGQTASTTLPVSADGCVHRWQ